MIIDNVGRNKNAMKITSGFIPLERRPLPGTENGQCGGTCCGKPCRGACWRCQNGLRCVGNVDVDGNGNGVCKQSISLCNILSQLKNINQLLL